MAFDDELSNFMEAIKQVESGGQYDIHPNRAGASGAYQFIDSTWGGYGGYAHAWQAPPEVQDAKARELMSAYYQSFGSWDLVAAAWNGGPGTAEKAQKDPGYLSRIGDGNMTVQSYVNKVMGILGTTSATDTVSQAAASAVSTAPASAPASAPAPAAPPPPKRSLEQNLLAVNDVAGGQSPGGSTDSLESRLSALNDIFGQSGFQLKGPK